MSERIEPAVDASTWKDVARIGLRFTEEAVGETDEQCAYLIGMNNAGLSETSRRKITRAWVNDLRSIAADAEARYDQSRDLTDLETAAKWNARADVLESYLPPEKP